MAKTNYVQKAEKQVEKAVGVFDKAIIEVDKAQETLQKGVEQDSFEISSLRTSLVKTKARISEIEQEKQEKGEAMKKNADLLERLKEFRG